MGTENNREDREEESMQCLEVVDEEEMAPPLLRDFAFHVKGPLVS